MSYPILFEQICNTNMDTQGETLTQEHTRIVTQLRPLHKMVAVQIVAILGPTNCRMLASQCSLSLSTHTSPRSVVLDTISIDEDHVGRE